MINLLPRLSKIAVCAIVLLALISLPMLRVGRNPGSALAPSVAWAGGSPDETLKPPDSPPPPPPPSSAKAASFVAVGKDGGTLRLARLTLTQRWAIFFSVLRNYAARL